MSTSDHDPRYVSSDYSGVPVSGADEWTTDEKEPKVEQAESKLELDVNGGQQVSEPTENHRWAAAAYATYLLTAGAVGPNSAKLGDVDDSGERRETYAQQFLTMYNQYVQQINAVDEDPEDGPGEHKDASFEVH